MDIEEKLRLAAQGLANAEGILRRAADAYPSLDGPGRAFMRMAKVANRPLRIGILGEANSGKSSLANLLAGTSVLPTDPVASTRLPALLKYAPMPSVTVIHESGERVAVPVREDVAQAVAAIQGGAGKGNLSAGKSAPPGSVKLLEVGFPSSLLRSIEILDIPISHLDMRRYRIDAAIWTTVATQAWRESERARWMKLPQAIRSRSLLAVTFCDLAAGRESDLKRLQSRLEKSAKPHFQGICFVANGDEDPAAAASRNAVLFVQTQYLVQEFTAERLGKAMTIARRVMGSAISKLGPGTGTTPNGDTTQLVAEASRGLFDDDWAATLKRQRPGDWYSKPSILLSQPGQPARRSPGPRARAEAGNSEGRTKWMTIGAAALLGGAVALAINQLGLIGTGNSPDPNPTLNTAKPVEQGTAANEEKRKKAEVEAAAGEARRKAEAEAAATEARRQAQAEAAATEARRKAEVEAAAAETRRQAQAEAAATEARRKAEVEAVAAEAHRQAQAEAAAAEARRQAEVEAVAAEARRQAEAETAAAELRRQAEVEADAAEAHKKAEAVAAESRRRKREEAQAAEAERRRKADAEEAERRRRAAEAAVPNRPAGGSPIMHGIGQ